MYVVHQEAIKAGLGSAEVQRAIDALVLEKAKSGEELPCSARRRALTLASLFKLAG